MVTKNIKIDHNMKERILFIGLSAFWMGCTTTQSSVVRTQSSGVVNEEFVIVSDPDPGRFSEEVDRYLDYDRKNYVPKGEIVFAGSSSIRLWPSAYYFPSLPIVNRGFGGSHMSDLQHYAEDLVLKHEPEIVVLYEGDNDVAGGKSADRTFSDIFEFGETLWMRNPRTQILFMAVKPSLARWDLWPIMDDVNQQVVDWARVDSRVHYVDIVTPMLLADGTPDPRLFIEDGLHLNKEGYDLWSSVLRSVLLSLAK